MFFASFLLRMPQTSSTLSHFFNVFKSVAPISLIQQIEDVFTILPASVDSPSFHSDLIPSLNPTVTDVVVYYPLFQFSDLGSTASMNRSAESVAWEVSQEEYFPSLEGEPVPNPTTHLHVLLLLVPPCVILVLCLIYVSHLRASVNATLKGALVKCFAFGPRFGFWERCPRASGTFSSRSTEHI
jgi:hypothetical protein